MLMINFVLTNRIIYCNIYLSEYLFLVMCFEHHMHDLTKSNEIKIYQSKKYKRVMFKNFQLVEKMLNFPFRIFNVIQ